MGDRSSVRDERRRPVTVVAAVLCAAVLGACVGDGTGDGAGEDQVPLPAQDLAAKPEIVLPETAPDTLQVSDLVEGDGDPAEAGDTLTVHLVATVLDSGRQVESTWELDAPRLIPLVPGGAVPGVVEGLVGARVNARRYLVVPPDLAYGDAGAPPDVPPDATLVFVVDVLGIDAGD